MQIAINNSPQLSFTQPDPDTIETIQRDLSDKKRTLKNLKEQMEAQLDMLNLNEEEKRAFLNGDI